LRGAPRISSSGPADSYYRHRATGPFVKNPAFRILDGSFHHLMFAHHEDNRDSDIDLAIPEPFDLSHAFSFPTRTLRTGKTCGHFDP
jgi:hypothetical protein